MVWVPTTSVLVVDDNPLVRRLLWQLFDVEPDFDVCGEAANGREAVEKAQELRPDLIVMDLAMPVINGLDAARALRRLMPRVPIIMFSEYSEALSDEEASSAGLAALVSKEEASKLIGTARRFSTRIAA